MKIPRIDLALLFLLLAAGPALADALVVDETIPLTLPSADDVVTVPVALPRSAVVTLVLVGPEEAVAGVEVRVRNPKDEVIDLRAPALLPAGDYAIDVRARQDLAVAPVLRVTGTVPVDPFEPNGSREQAAAVSPPLREWVLLTGERSDWFRFDADESGVLCVQFRRPAGGSQIYFGFEDGEGREIWRCVDEWDWQGARFFAVEKGRRYVLWAGQDGGAPAFAELEIGLYRPGDVLHDDQAGRILVVGLDPGSPDLAQLRHMATATAVPLTATVAEDVRGMTEELVGDVERATAPPPAGKEEKGGGSSWPVALVLAAAAAAVLFLRRRAKAS